MQPSNSSIPNPPNSSRTASLMKRYARRLLHAGECVLAMIGAANLIYLCCFDLSVITSSSMAPTLKGTSIKNGDHVLAERVSFWFRDPWRWEVIMYFSPEGTRVMKRVVGLPGETISLPREGELLIGGERVMPPDANSKYWYAPQGNLTQGRSVSCGDGYYLLGDSTSDSDDSRFNGPLPADKVAGRAWLIVWPWERMGFVNP